MHRIARLLQQLESPNKNERYEACEHLRVAPSLPPGALAALVAHTKDPDEDVAEAARTAIALHTVSNEPIILPELPERAKADSVTRVQGAMVAALVFLGFGLVGLGEPLLVPMICWCALMPVAAVLGWVAVGAANAWGWRITGLTMVVAFVCFIVTFLGILVWRGFSFPNASPFLAAFAPIAVLAGLWCFTLAKRWRGRLPILWAGAGAAATGPALMLAIEVAWSQLSQ